MFLKLEISAGKNQRGINSFKLMKIVFPAQRHHSHQFIELSFATVFFSSSVGGWRFYLCFSGFSRFLGTYSSLERPRRNKPHFSSIPTDSHMYSSLLSFSFCAFSATILNARNIDYHPPNDDLSIDPVAAVFPENDNQILPTTNGSSLPPSPPLPILNIKIEFLT